MDLPFPSCKARQATTRRRISFILKFQSSSLPKQENPQGGGNALLSETKPLRSEEQKCKLCEGLQADKFPVKTAQPTVCVMVSWSLLLVQSAVSGNFYL